MKPAIAINDRGGSIRCIAVAPEGSVKRTTVLLDGTCSLDCETNSCVLELRWTLKMDGESSKS